MRQFLITLLAASLGAVIGLNFYDHVHILVRVSPDEDDDEVGFGNPEPPMGYKF